MLEFRLFWVGMLLVFPSLHVAAQTDQHVLIVLKSDGNLQVEGTAQRSVKLASTDRGLVVWANEAGEGWDFISPGESWSRPASASHSNVQRLSQASRGSNGDLAAASSGQFSLPLEQLLGQAVVRGASFLTPHNGFILNGRITIRRRPSRTGSKFPAAAAILSRGNTQLARITFVEGQDQIAFDRIAGLAEKMPNGLAPGEYTLRIEGGPESSAFTVEDTAWRDEVMGLPDELASVLGNRLSPLSLQITAEHLLDQRDEDNKPLAYLSDALNILESIPEEELTTYLAGLRTRIYGRLSGQPLDAPNPSSKRDAAKQSSPILSGAHVANLREGVKKAKAHLLAVLDVLDQSLKAGGPNGTAWRQYLRFDELTAQLADDSQPDVTVLQLARDRFASDEAGLKLAVFADVGRALDNYIAELSRWSSAVRLRQAEQLAASENSADNNGTSLKDNRSIERARELIASGNWREASAELNLELLSGNRRTRAMATLYNAVIMAESGLGTEGAAGATFEQAIDMLADGGIADRYRAHNNFANFLMNQTQDRLHNHAFQIAAGVRQPITTALQLWVGAEEHYRTAFELARQLDANQRSATQVNLARLYSLLSDVIRTLDVSADGKRQFTAGAEAADRVAEQFARHVGSLDATEKIDPIVLASAEEILARLAFRADDLVKCRDHANRALRLYQEAGSLVGVEGCHRMIGLSFLRAKNTASGSGQDQRQEDATKHLLISLHVAEFLRDRIPPDQMGVSRAGFFARRAYVNDRLVGLLIDQKKPVEALRFAEMAKARSLQDLLVNASDGKRALDIEKEEPRSVTQLLDEWPESCAALEYYLTDDKAWLFFINTRGAVKAFDLLGSERTPPALIGDVRKLLNRMDGMFEKMRRRLLSGRGFDQAWQHELHELYRTLIPSGVLDELRKADTVVVVPHHILHYVPFAALVSQPDEQTRGTYEMVNPKFLLDEPFDLVYCPSIRVWDRLQAHTPRPITQVRAVAIVDFPSAPSLPGVEKDLANLKAAFGDKVRNVLLESEANEHNVQQLLDQPGMLLFATHGFNQADQPLDSFLLLTPTSDSDGRLTANELFQRHVAADIVVMSACYSGLADRSPLPGDDLFGVQRALLQSGARTVVSGLWDVYDGTGPDLMKDFFVRLAEGDSAAAALSTSQRTFLRKARLTKDDPFLHPYFWAVFAITGDNRTSIAK